jgi:hypothetical protein
LEIDATTLKGRFMDAVGDQIVPSSNFYVMQVSVDEQRPKDFEIATQNPKIKSLALSALDW